jgi:hypothetical protein
VIPNVFDRLWLKFGWLKCSACGAVDPPVIAGHDEPGVAPGQACRHRRLKAEAECVALFEPCPGRYVTHAGAAREVTA